MNFLKMKTKLLINLRKYYDYKFTDKGEVVTRNKKTGNVRVYESIEAYVRAISYTDVFIDRVMSHLWNKKKLTIKDKQMSSDEQFWNSI